MKTTSRLLVCSLAMSLWALAAPAWAHDETGLAGGFISGLRHPVLGFDHLLAMVAVGLWGAVLGRPLIAALPVIFPAFMVVGGLLGIAGAPMAPVEIGIALSVLLLGAAIAARFVAPVWLACLLVGVFGLFHGYAHGQELPVAADPTAYGLGFVLATGALHGAGIGLGLLDRRRGGRRALRVLGALIALAGVYFLYKATLA
jgi:urease accessory protein